MRILLPVTFLFSVAIGVIWIRTATVKATYHYVQEQKKLAQLEQEVQSARIQWLKLSSPRKLESLGRNLGLGYPKIEQVVQFKKAIDKNPLSENQK